MVLNQFPPLKFENNIPFNFQESNVFKLAPNSVDDLSSISPTLRIHMFGSMPNLVPLNFNQCKILVYYPTQNMMSTTNHMPNALKQNSMLCY